MKVTITRMYRGHLASVHGGMLLEGSEYDLPEDTVRELANRQPPHCELLEPEPVAGEPERVSAPRRRRGRDNG